MPDTKSPSLAGVKRKRDASSQHKSKTRRKSSPSDGDGDGDSNSNDVHAEILHLEAQILESRRHYNNIATLLQRARQPEPAKANAAPILAAVALCRVFSRLLATGDMVKSKGMGEAEAVIVSWLKERYKDLLDVLLDGFLRSDDAPRQSTALTLVMRLVKDESRAQKDHNIKNGPLPRLVKVLLLLPHDDPNRDEFAQKYFKLFDDIRYHTFHTIT